MAQVTSFTATLEYPEGASSSNPAGLYSKGAYGKRANPSTSKTAKRDKSKPAACSQRLERLLDSSTAHSGAHLLKVLQAITYERSNIISISVSTLVLTLCTPSRPTEPELDTDVGQFWIFHIVSMLWNEDKVAEEQFLTFATFQS